MPADCKCEKDHVNKFVKAFIAIGTQVRHPTRLCMHACVHVCAEMYKT